LHLYSKGCEYAIRALTVIRLKESQRGFSIKEVCRKAGIPEFFTRKIFQALVKNDLLAARSGPGGGYRFQKDPGKISLLNIICAIDGSNAFEKCVIKDFKCNKNNYCTLHPMWTKTKVNMMMELESQKIAKLMKS
jgi:Rrf2 family protein